MVLFDNLKIASYAAAADAFDKSQDLFEGFLPLVETALCSYGAASSVSFLSLRDRINEIHGVDIQKETLRHLINILEAQGNVEFDRKTIYPDKNWLSDSVCHFDTHQSSLNTLFQTFRDYLAQNGCSVSISDIRIQVCEWVYLHSADLAQFVASGAADKKKIRPDGNNDWEYADMLIAFLVECHKEKPYLYETFIRLYDGAVQASLLNFTPNEISSVIGREFLVKKAVLDTNFVLRLIGLQAPLDNEVAQSTFQCLREVGVECCVLSQTIEETCTSIDGFLREMEPVAQQATRFLPKTNITTSGFWAALQSGVSRTEFLEWANPDKLIQELTTKFSVAVIDDYEDPAIKAEAVKDLIAFKNVDKYAESQAKHDLTLIAYCEGRRSRRPHSLGEEHWWVLTNDAKLASWNRRRNRLPACMTSVQVSNLLWLFTKKDSGAGLTNTIVSLAGRDAVSSTEISNFAARMGRYGEEYGSDPGAVKNLSNVLAHAVLSTNDIRKGGSSDSEFYDMIDRLAEEIRNKQKIEETRYAEATDSQKREIDELKRKMELGKLQSKKRQKTDGISAAKKSIAQIEKSIGEINDIQEFCSKEERKAARKVYFKFVRVCLSILILALLVYNPLATFISRYKTFAGQVSDFTGYGIVTLVFGVIYYSVVCFTLSGLYSPKELFDELKKRALLQEREKYILSKTYSTDFAHGMLETHRVELVNRLKNEQDNLSSLESELQDIEDAIILL